VSRFGLVAAFTIRSLYKSDNNVASIELEISGNLVKLGEASYYIGIT
jgi:hypothetical protein